jgi:hypothetical protein
MNKQYLISIKKETLENNSDELFFKDFFDSYLEINTSFDKKKITLEKNGIQFFNFANSDVCGIYAIGQNWGGCIEQFPASCFDVFKNDFSDFKKIIAKHAARKNNFIVSKTFEDSYFKYDFEDEVLVFSISELELINLSNKTIAAKKHLKTKILSDYINNNTISYPKCIGSHSFAEIGIYLTYNNTGDSLCSIAPLIYPSIKVIKDIYKKENIAIIYNEILNRIGYEFRI